MKKASSGAGDKRWHTLSPKEVLDHFGVNEEQGLSDADVQVARTSFGFNELEKEEPTSLLALFLEQFDDTLVKILLGAATVSFLLALTEDTDEGITAYVEPIVILVILILNAIVGVWQESNAEAALEALKELQPENARVLRDGELQTIEARELVPGDIVEVRVGDKIPADLRLISLRTTSMRVEQAQMTGESTSVNKDIDALPSSSEDVIQAKTNMLFATTIVVNGIGHGVVVHTGMETEIGKIQASVKEAAEEDDSTPLKKKLDDFGELLSKIIGVICVLVWVINYPNFYDPAHGSFIRGCIYYFKIAIALAVAAIPEGLPAVITTCLALGTRKMAKKNAIVRKLPSVETLGCTTVICSDKTGTLTTNEMSVISFNVMGENDSQLLEFDVDGHSYEPTGNVKGLNKANNGEALQDFCRIGSLCNEAKIDFLDGKYVRVGEPTEAAIKVLVEKIGRACEMEKAELRNGRVNMARVYCDHIESQFDKLATLEFSRDRKSMSVLARPAGMNGRDEPRTRRQAQLQSDSSVLLVKGAPENVLSRCTHMKLANGKVVAMSQRCREMLLSHVTDKASQALRCLALAMKEDLGALASYDGDRHHPAHKSLADVEGFAEIESDLTFVGLCSMRDPPRPEVRESIETCRQAGIRVIVITGDNKLTAESICRQIGVFDEKEDLSKKSFTGAEFFSLTEKQRDTAMMENGGGRVFSRTEPKHKQALVKMLKRLGEVAAMTGDGVNDAPALKQADIGIAMGITGTEVAKEAADMVLADDNFATIVHAVEEGRAIYNNMQAFIRYLISSNIGEVAAIFFTAMLGLPEGLIPVQLLWVNLVTDGPPATALGFNPADPTLMKRPPRKTDDSLINGWVFFRYLVIGVYVGCACVGIFVYWYLYYDKSGDGHSLITWSQLTNWSECPNWKGFSVNNFDNMDFSGGNACKYFSEGKVTASTLSLSVLVTIEMLNALNALSEDMSLLVMPPWCNPYLIIAIVASFLMHFVILYIPFMASIFSVTPLDFNEWMLVLYFSFPVIILDEILKFIGRNFVNRPVADAPMKKSV